ncbi:hypothetical protein BH24DEI1_BH24DEI1_08620 [soil metagenome]
MIAKIAGFLTLTLCLSAAFAQEGGASVADLLLAGDNYVRQNDCFTAIQAYNMVLDREPDNVEAHLGRGRALFCEGAVAMAAEDFRQVITTDSSNVLGYVWLARAYRTQYQDSPREGAGRLDDALGVLQDAERIDNQYAPLYNERGLVLRERGDLEGSRTAFETAIERARSQDAPAAEQALYHMHAGVSYRDLGQPEQALASFRRAVAMDPRNAAARNYLGVTYKGLERCEDAVFELEQAVQLNPSFREANTNLGVTLFDCGQVEASERYLRRALEIDPLSYPGIYIYLSRVSLQQGRLDEAVDTASRGAILPPNSADAWYWLGQAFQERGAADDANNACDAYRNALQLDADHSEARGALDRSCQ